VQDQAGLVGGWLRAGRPVVRAVLTGVEGSAPLPPGASLFVTADGAIEGSITGGCVESALAHEAGELLAGGPPRLVTYGISDELAGTAGLTCGGTVHVFLHLLAPGSPQAAAVLAALEAVDAGRPAAIATLLDGADAGATLAVIPGDPAASGAAGALDAPAVPAARRSEPPVAGAAHAAGPTGDLGGGLLQASVARDAAGLLDRGITTVRSYGADGATLGAELRVHVRAFAPPPQMLLFGAIDFSAALAPLARELGYRVTISDPRADFARAPRFARAAEVLVGWPQAAYAGRAFGPRDAILVFSHDPRLDVPALLGALASDAGYIGALGSRRTTAERSERLRAAGASERQIARIHAPCGLDIGGRTPEETAISILAEIVAVRSARPAAPLRETGGPIQRDERGVA
jgi:xanthine dehydrogenase accessory factor